MFFVSPMTTKMTSRVCICYGLCARRLSTMTENLKVLSLIFCFLFFFKSWPSKNIKSIISRNRDWRLINDCLFLFTNFDLSEILMFYRTRLKFLWKNVREKKNKNDNNRRKKQSINNNVICMKRKTLNTLQYL